MILFCIILAACLIFGRALFGEFLFDDPSIRDQAQSGAFLRPSFRTFGQFWHASRPVTDEVQRLIWRLSGLTPWPWHLANLLTHAACITLFYFLLAPLPRIGPAQATMGAAIFAFHPLQASSVCYVSGLPAMLATFFTLCGLTLFQMGHPWPLLCAILAQFLAVKSKPDAILYTAFYPIVWHFSRPI